MQIISIACTEVCSFCLLQVTKAQLTIDENFKKVYLNYAQTPKPSAFMKNLPVLLNAHRVKFKTNTVSTWGYRGTGG